MMNLSKLHLKLTCINLIVLAALFCALLCGAYFFLHFEINKRAERMAERIADDYCSGRMETQTRPHDFPGPPLLLVKVGPSGIFPISTPHHFPFPESKIRQLAKKALAETPSSGVITLDDSSFFQYRTPPDANGDQLLVLQDFRPELDFLRFLLIALALIALAILALSLLLSLALGRRALIPLENAWKQQHEFLADASHELRTPLAVIQANLEIVLENPYATVISQKNWLQNIKTEFDHLTKLVNALLFLARLDAKEQSLNKRTFSFAALAAKVAASFAPLAETRQIKIESEIPSAVLLCADEEKIRNLLEILFDNALRHTPEKGVIRLSADFSQLLLHFSFSDNGEGIAPQHLTRIFDRFYQADASRSGGNSGLGLAIAKSIVSEHGGSIDVTSAPGSGTTFLIVLPLK